jgi:hypothetical protein
MSGRTHRPVPGTSLLMAAASVDLPAVVVPGGPMLTCTFRGVSLGCGTDVWRLSEAAHGTGWSWRWSPLTGGRARSSRMLRSPTRS